MKITDARPQRSAATPGTAAYASIQRTTRRGSAEAPKSADVSSVLNIPEQEFTPRVREAIMALMAEVKSLREELEGTKARLQSAEAMADQDSLLPVLNRRAFAREMSRIMSFSDRYDHAACLIYFDLDGFKAINDEHGHAAGDAALAHVAALLAANVRESDTVGRLGGDEFGVILAKADKLHAEAKAQSLANLIEATPVAWAGKTLRLSTACGTHAFQKGETAEAAMSNADRAMYAVKRKVDKPK